MTTTDFFLDLAIWIYVTGLILVVVWNSIEENWDRVVLAPFWPFYYIKKVIEVLRK